MQIGPPAEIYERPNSRFVADFVGAVNLFEGELVAGVQCAFALEDCRRPSSRSRCRRPVPSCRRASRLALAVRPEKLRLSTERPEGFALAATIASISYQGGQSTIHLATRSGLRCGPICRARRRYGLDRGTAVWASWAPDDAVVLTE